MKETADRRGLLRYELDDGWAAVAGRTDADNERLSLKLADRNDFWLHVKGESGSHVILFKADDPAAEAPPAILQQAAAIAAWHSKARRAGIVPVHVTRAVHVGKPRGARTGTVTIRNEKTIKTRPGLPPGTRE